ncbi:hypothetical protein [Natronococcus occultus]|uniref:Uncharacterized protein n=1 Tax=Natronococcus occultus SP4 TaxID=694430 RepID=L0K740_9EURY|nr:hypothetical protein [Natronococcus occultus]AGB39943.1 hypothetical protein Natoc_4251 [Natronococcus occultus SP4]
MEDLHSYAVGETVRDLRGDGNEYRVVEKETSSVGKITAIVVEPLDEDGTKRLRISQSEWGETWTA